MIASHQFFWLLAHFSTRRFWRRIAAGVKGCSRRERFLIDGVMRIDMQHSPIENAVANRDPIEATVCDGWSRLRGALGAGGAEAVRGSAGGSGPRCADMYI